jgi:hypothetical protein
VSYPLGAVLRKITEHERVCYVTNDRPDAWTRPPGEPPRVWGYWRTLTRDKEWSGPYWAPASAVELHPDGDQIWADYVAEQLR